MDTLIRIFIIAIIISAAIEAIILGYGFYEADEVECNFLWCTFTEIRETRNINRNCSVNGQQVPCEELDDIFEEAKAKWT